MNTPLLTEPGIPRVAIHTKTDFPGVVALTPGNESLERRVIEMLVAKGRRRVGIIMACVELSGTGIARAPLISKLQEHGIETRPEWTHAVALEHPQGARNIAQLLMSAEYSRRPDALLILNDNLVPEATAGVAAAGVRVPEDADVIAHCNFPWPTPSAVPARRIGCDTTALLETCIGLIDDQRAGRDVPAMVSVPIQWEEEVAHAFTRAAGTTAREADLLTKT